VQTEKKI
jgi:hypothetical protein